MATTIPDISVLDDAWTDVNTASGITVGLAMTIQNKGGSFVYLYEGATPPSVLSKSGEILSSTYYPASRGNIVIGSDRIWARCASTGKASRISVQAT